MCGIAGIWHLNGTPLPKGKLEKFTDAITERGPDGSGYDYFDDEALGLGHRRLSILDLTEAGRQPMNYAEGRYSITYNGEVYNFADIQKELEEKGHKFITRTDTEVILAAYAEWGVEALHRFNGMFAIAIWDRVEKRLFLARDRFGIKPFYYLHIPGKLFAFASETRAFKKLDGYTRQFNQRMIELQRSNVRIHGSGRSIYQGIFQILPGHFVYLTRENELAQKRWWNVADAVRKDIPNNPKEQAEEFYELFRDACKLRLISDVSIATALSGGLDSSSVYSTVFDVIRSGAGSRVPDDAQKAFVATFPGLLSDERHYAEEALSFTNGPAIFLDQKYANLGEQIIEDTIKFDGLSNIPITSISGIYRGMRNHGITVSMDGHGVDEMLYGYRDMIYNLFYYYYNKGDKRNAKLVRDVMVPTYHESERARVLADLQNTMKNSRSPLWKGKQMIRSIIGKPVSDRSEYRVPEELRTLGEPYDFSEMNYPDRIVYAETFVETLPDIFRDFDLAAMANGVEIRMPFMDYRLVSFIFSLPMESKIGNGFTKLILRDAMKGKMSEPIRTRQHKIGIGSPLEHWFRNDLKDWALDILSSDEKRNNPMLVDSNFLPDLEKGYADNTVTKEQIFLAWKEINLHTIA